MIEKDIREGLDAALFRATLAECWRDGVIHGASGTITDEEIRKASFAYADEKLRYFANWEQPELATIKCGRELERAGR